MSPTLLPIYVELSTYSADNAVLKHDILTWDNQFPDIGNGLLLQGMYDENHIWLEINSGADLE
jgi:hypothetical protein